MATRRETFTVVLALAAVATTTSGTAHERPLPQGSAFEIRLAPEVLRRLASSPSSVRLPLPDTSWARFELEPYPVIPPGLARRFPGIRAYRGEAPNRPGARVWMTVGPIGLHASVTVDGETHFIEPIPGAGAPADAVPDRYRVRGYRELVPAGEGPVCAMPRTSAAAGIESPSGLRFDPRVAGDVLHSYRIAIASTGAFTSFHGGTVEGGLAAVVAVLTQVSAVFERDVSVRFVLAEDNDRLIFTDAATDPYTDDNHETLMEENQELVDQVIGTAAYDLGHVLTSNHGGMAQYLGQICWEGNKARGVSGFWNGQVFGLAGIVIHEVGHQLGADHTFNSSIGVCGSFRHSRAAWEPGAGSTIMSYAGSCGADSYTGLKGHYFHAGSFRDIRTVIELGCGRQCGEVTDTGNEPPSVDAGRERYLPARTPFVLAGEAADADGDNLLFCWEQFDLGPPSPPMTDDGQRPIFRSFAPKRDPYRVFPRMRDVLSGGVRPGEAWAETDRVLTFRFTAQDGRGGTAIDETVIEVVAAAGPFVVKAPAKRSVWSAGGRARVAWSVAGTNQAPIGCRRVKLSLSTDGGQTWPIVLARRTRNDGGIRVQVPDVRTRRARVRVDCANNVFFAVSPGSFSIQ